MPQHSHWIIFHSIVQVFNVVEKGFVPFYICQTMQNSSDMTNQCLFNLKKSFFVKNSRIEEI